jgi:hypothetical protein
MAKKREAQEIAQELVRKSFSLSEFKEKKGFSSSSIKFKTQSWIPFSKALQDATSMPGIAVGQINLLRGHTDTGKTEALIEVAISCQKMRIMPVLIITEMKWSWEHVKLMGFSYDEIVDESTGEIVNYDGLFLYADRSTLTTIEDVAAYIADLLNEQDKGNLPYDLCFLWDSVGSIPCELSIKSQKNNNEWNAGAMSTQFGNFINQKILISRKESSKYTNTLVATNKTWTMKPESPMGQPKLMNKAGFAMWSDSALVFTFGSIMSSGTSKIKAIKSGKQVEFAKITKIQVDKNHINGVQSRGTVVMTPHGFIPNTKDAIDQYKKDYSKYWEKILGSVDFELFEEEPEDVTPVESTEESSD